MEVTSPFGSQTRTRVLLALSLLEQSYSRELSRILKVPISVLQKAVLSLERDGLVVARTMGQTRVVSLNPRFFARRELVALLNRLAEPEDRLRAAVAKLRKRPRRSGKRL
jgi:DNA-binding transcriptional ArsR family regulator